MTGDSEPDHEIVGNGPQLFFPVRVHDAESGKRDGVPWLAVTMLIGTDDAGYIPWYVLRCLN